MFRINTHVLATAAVGIWFFGSGIVLAQSDMNAPPDSLTIADTGNIGVGTASPEGPLHVETDIAGVALAAIQGLNSLVQEKEAKIHAMEQTIAAQQAVLEKLNKRLAALETVVAAGATATVPVTAHPAAANTAAKNTLSSY